MIYPTGATSQSIDVQVVDDAGLPVTGLVAGTMPALTYSRAGANADVAFPALSDLAAITTAWAAGGVKERGGGVYRLDVPDAAFAVAGEVKIRGEATNKRVLAPWVDVGKPAVTVASTDVSGNLPANILAVNSGGGSIDGLDELCNDYANGSIHATDALGGALATSTEVTAIQNNTRCVRVVPDVIERPDSGTTTYRIELLLYDEVGNMEAPDSAPTLALVNQSGTDLSSRLGSTTGSLVSTGRYRWTYTASVADTLEQLVWAFSVVEGGATRVYGNTTVIVDTTAVDFTASDRTTLNALAAGVNLTAVNGDTDAALGLASLGDAVQGGVFLDDVATSVRDFDNSAPTPGGMGAALNTIKAKTNNLPAAPASTTNITSAAGIQLAANQDVRNVTGAVAGAVGSVAAGVTLAAGAISDASFTVPAEGTHTGPVGWLRRLYRRWYNRVVRDATTVKVYRDNGTTVDGTSTYTASGSNEDVGAAT